MLWSIACFYAEIKAGQALGEAELSHLVRGN